MKTKKKHGSALGEVLPEKDRGETTQPMKSGEAFVFYSNPIVTLVCMLPKSEFEISLGDAAQKAGVHPELLRYYCRVGLLGRERSGKNKLLVFDADALDGIARIEHYRRHLGVRRRTLYLVEELWREGKRQGIEIGFLNPPGRLTLGCNSEKR